MSETLRAATRELVPLFLAARGKVGRGELRDEDALDLEIERVIHEAHAAWPDAALELPGFVQHLARHSPTRLAMGAIRGGDLYLAFACLRGEKWAVELFVRHLLPKAVAAARAVHRDRRADDEVTQELSMRILVGDKSGEPKIAGYAGLGPLESWVRSAAVRTAQNWATRQPRGEALDAGLELQGGNLELDFLKGRYAREFKVAFEAALRKLPAEDLSLVRLHAVDKVSIDRLSAMYQIHRATAARRIARARQFLADETQSALTSQLGLESQELASLLRLVRSNVDLSLARLLPPGTG